MPQSQSRPGQSTPQNGHTVRPPGAPPTGELPWFFRPFPKLPEKWQSPLAQDQLLNEYLIHHGNFFHFATSRGLTVDQLFDWLHSEQVVDRRKRMEFLANERAALLLRLARPAAIDALARTLLDPNTNPRDYRLAASAILRAAQAADKRDQSELRVESDTSRERSERIGPGPRRPGQPSQPAPLSPQSSALSPSSPLVLARIGRTRSPIPPRNPIPSPPRATMIPRNSRPPSAVSQARDRTSNSG